MFLFKVIKKLETFCSSISATVCKYIQYFRCCQITLHEFFTDLFTYRLYESTFSSHNSQYLILSFVFFLKNIFNLIWGNYFRILWLVCAMHKYESFSKRLLYLLIIDIHFSLICLFPYFVPQDNFLMQICLYIEELCFLANVNVFQLIFFVFICAFFSDILNFIYSF